MSFMSFLGMASLILLAYILLWSIIDRICKCCETCTMAKAFGGSNREAIDKIIDAINKK